MRLIFNPSCSNTYSKLNVNPQWILFSEKVKSTQLGKPHRASMQRYITKKLFWNKCCIVYFYKCLAGVFIREIIIDPVRTPQNSNYRLFKGDRTDWKELLKPAYPDEKLAHHILVVIFCVGAHFRNSII